MEILTSNAIPPIKCEECGNNAYYIGGGEKTKEKRYLCAVCRSETVKPLASTPEKQ